jgi:uncharacterized alkaline shock family protein YloU
MAAAAGSPAQSTLEVARSAADAARSHDDVVDLDAGLAREFATYGLGGRVPGVRVEREQDRTRVRLRIVVRFGRPLPDIGDEVRARVAAALRDVGAPEIHVHVADIADPGGQPSAAPAELEPPGAP